MKKIIAAAVAASMVVPCFSVSAAERVKEVSSVYEIGRASCRERV